MQFPIQSKTGEFMSAIFRSICRLFSTTAVFMLLFQFAEAQSGFDEADALLEKYKKALGNNAVLMVWKEGKVVHQKAIGEYTVKTQVPIDGAGRWISAAVIMKLVEEGKIELDAPIAQYLPIFSKYLKNYITVRHCLSNTTGTEGSLGLGLLKKKKFENLEAAVNAFAAREILQKPGEAFHYGDIGISVAARIAEVVTKKGFDRLVQEKITRPLKMRGTNFNNDTGGAIDPAEGAKSSPQDYINFLSMLMNEGKFEDKQILSKESVDELLKSQLGDAKIVYIPAAMRDFAYGFGCFVHERDNAGNGTIVSCPSFTGTWPWINREKKYACILIAKGGGLMEQKRDFFEQLRAAVESSL